MVTIECWRRRGTLGCVTAHVLVVEDDASVRETVSLVLTNSGFAVTTAADGDTAVKEALRPGAHDLVLLDLMLPGKNGLDVCREVRRVSSIPIVMLTARADTRRRRCRPRVGCRRLRD